MDERKMLEKIAESARNVEIPDGLEPQRVHMFLQNRQKKKRRFYKVAAAAACLCLCFGVGGYTLHRAGRAASSAQEGSLYANRADDASEKVQKAGADGQAPAVIAPLKKIGRMYTLAENYGDVYDVVMASQQNMKNSGERKGIADGGKEIVENAREESAIFDMDDASKQMANAAVSKQDDYSGTNLQVEGVDESDIVKTDGKYIYVVHNSQVQVLNIQNRAPKKAAAIKPDLNEDTDMVCEMYVSGNILVLLVQTEETALEQGEPQAGQGTSESKKLALDDVVYMNLSASTKVLTYDIANPEKPFLKDTAVQDGWYQTSRKIGDCLYLFTRQDMYPPNDILYKASEEGKADKLREQAVSDANASQWVPRVNGEAVDAGCIYLPKRGNRGLLITSIDLADHNKALDTKLVINNAAELYVTRHSVYLYETDYVKNVQKTRIARFALEEGGKISAKAAAVIKGGIEDTFAIHERDGYLQVLTCVTSKDPCENRVYVLNENMEVTGKLTGLAEGELIYSARFAGTAGYFVTYRNTDPLFSVDFSDPSAPKVIGELKVTGFSEYLHFWSGTQLLGIGKETNPESGEVIGIKLSMFDISDPAKAVEEGKLVLEGVENCEGMYNYKAVLADGRKNVIALTTESYQDGYKKNYRVFSYQDGTFQSQAVKPLKADYESQWRSVYAGDILYLVGENKTVAFDMKDGWKVVGKVKY